MTPKSTPVPPELFDYLIGHGMAPDGVQNDLIAETQATMGDLSGMQIAPDQGAFLTLLARILGVRDAVEVGTFTGYSSLCLARGLAPGGRLICCDVSEEFTSVARRYWDRAGLTDRIELRLGPALDTLRAMPADQAFDLAFIDADKPGYVAYWDELVPRIRPGGVLLVDNVFYHGRVVHPADQADNVVGIRRFNDHAAADDRVELTMLTIGDGLTLARKR
ncbi:MAG TPA: O-methyltransferase [Mycobacteriales bacterium]|nr:O-methyltransferase [Mycobacteriales bacterium]